MQHNKLVGFLRGLIYPILMALITTVISTLGQSGLVTVGEASIITGILSMLEHALESSSGSALFGLVRTA